MNIGIFGGTFDPPHYGHINLAQHILSFKKLDRILFVLSAAPPHKPNRPITLFEHRFNMLNMAIEGENRFEISTIEKKRLPLPSYTYDTMVHLTESLNNDKLFMIIGGDSLLQLHTWYKALKLVQEFNFIIYPRPNEIITYSKLKDNWSKLLTNKLIGSVISSSLFPVSSTEIRKKINSKCNLKNIVDEKILAYIRKNHLYQNINSSLK
ncbi:MAG TPA: nicotinate (nicotinamide) nucleotide adenylyltransferase [Victivallales bacterium]|nr:nicotinate (nicotinamide) nucleotide adenylyltransferase [Victivallales bacterium]